MKTKEIKIKKWLFSTLLFSIAFVVVGLATLISDTQVAVNTIHFLNSTGFLNATRITDQIITITGGDITGADDVNFTEGYQNGNLVLDIADTFGGDVSGTYNDITVSNTSGLDTGNITSGELPDARVSDTLTCSNMEGTDWGTMTNAKWCVYDSTGTEVDCNVEPVTDTANTSAEIITAINQTDYYYQIFAKDLTCTNCIGGTEIAELADADISNTLTCSDLVAGSEVVVDTEVADDITIDSSKWVNTTAGVNTTKVYNEWNCLTQDCTHNMTYNGTHVVIQ